MAMTKQYSCDLCKKVFNQKNDFTRHKNKKTPCISLTEIEQIIKIKEVNSDDKTVLTNTFKYCLNILRVEGLTGDKGLRNMSFLLILKLLESQFENEIDIDNYKYDFSHIEDEMVDNHRTKLLEIVRFSKLANEKDDNILVNIKHLWDDILSKHPSTKNIFLSGKGFDIRHKSTFRKLIDKINSIDLSQTEYDVLGNSYEEVIQDIMTGKVLGQYFTQPLVKKMMVKLIDPEIYSDGKIDSCCDPTMGTGGFLITYNKYILEKAKTLNIKPDWNFIKTQGLYGKEIEPDTYQLAVSNMLISSGHMFEQLDRGDSIREPITRKFDNVLMNSPFGIKGLSYDDFENSIKNQYLPIKTDNAVSLFIQVAISILKINGKCACVLPDGQDLFLKTNKTLVNIREYLLKTCELKEIIYLPSGIFTNTTIKTCVFYFVKKREGKDVLETEIKVSKTQKETGRDYKFSKTHQTTKVKFYDYNPYEDVKNLLVEVPIEKIVSNSYSLNYSEYMKDETDEEQYEEGVTIKTLGEVCEIEKNLKKYDTSYGKSEGKYKFHTGGKRTDLYVDECDIKELYIIQNRTNGSGKCNLYLDKNFSLAKQTIVYRALNKDENTTKYIYYYLLFNKELLEKGFVGANHKNISKEYINNIKIPIPSLERQKEIVDYCEYHYIHNPQQLEKEIENSKRLAEQFINRIKLQTTDIEEKDRTPAVGCIQCSSMSSSSSASEGFCSQNCKELYENVEKFKAEHKNYIGCIKCSTMSPGGFCSKSCKEIKESKENIEYEIESNYSDCNKEKYDTDYTKMNRKQLILECKKRGLKNYSPKKKDELIKMLLQ
jgi:type I restriction-modification system DNA methylase subunit